MEERILTCDAPLGVLGGACGERVPNDRPFTFTLDGVDYKADLCQRHQDGLRKAISHFVEISQPVRVNGTTAHHGKRKARVFNTKDVRAWLLEQGREVAPSGRLAKELIEEYKRAHELG